MFRRKEDLSAVVATQGERLVKIEAENDELKIKNEYANRKCLDLQGQVDDLTDERIEELKTIASHLTRNDYGNPRAKIAIALEFIENKLKELSNT